jgi:hypothetical protein
MSSESGTFTPTPEQLALREARRLKKQQAANVATSSTPAGPLVNREKGHIVARPWLAVQGIPPIASGSVKIMTWNVRSFYFHLSRVHSVGETYDHSSIFSALSPMPRS